MRTTFKALIVLLLVYTATIVPAQAFEYGAQHYEESVFACSRYADLNTSNWSNSDAAWMGSFYQCMGLVGYNNISDNDLVANAENFYAQQYQGQY